MSEESVVVSPAAPSGERWEALRVAIARARRSEFYARHLAGRAADRPEDFSSLPFTRKEDLAGAGTCGMLAVPAAHAWHYHESSGTTGQPISTWCGLAELGRMADVIAAMVPEFGAPDAMFLNRFPSFAPIHHLLEEVLRRTERCHVAAGTMSWDVPFARALEFMRRLPLTMLGTLPFEMILLREATRALGLEPRATGGSLRAILLGGAVLPSALRRVIEADWGARVVEIYGSNETMLLGIGCTQGALHLTTELYQAEVLDPETMVPVAAGAPGILTVTSLVHETMPLVRYVTGDLVQVDATPCACGATTPSARVLGRVGDVLVFEGRRLTPAALLDACYEFVAAIGARVFFVVVLRRGLEILVEAPGRRPGSAAIEEIRLGERLKMPVAVRYLDEGDVLDRSALFRVPKIYKPGQVSDWRGQSRKTLTIMEALLEWPKFDLRTLGGIVWREVKNARRRKRLAASDR